jgi:hypothetical protein
MSKISLIIKANYSPVLYTVQIIFLFLMILYPVPALTTSEEYHVQSTNEDLISNAKFTEAVWHNADPEIRTALSTYQFFVLDITGYFEDHALVKKYKVIRVPTFILFDANGNVLRQIDGLQEKSKFLGFLGKTIP